MRRLHPPVPTPPRPLAAADCGVGAALHVQHASSTRARAGPARRYCSSDSWFGDAPATTTTFGFAFRGARIIDATIQSLVTVNGLGKTPGAKVCFLFFPLFPPFPPF